MSKSTLCCWALFCKLSLAAAAPPSLSALQAILAEQRLPPGHIGLFVGPADGGEPLVTMNADQPLNPASAIKLLPTLALLETFSAAHQWRTGLYTRGAIENNELKGDLYIKGGGDPYLTLESLWVMLKSVRAAGIDAIAGDIVVDDRVYTPPPADRAAFDGKPYRAYNGPAGGLMINFWSVRFTITALDGRVHIDAFPASERLRIVNRIEHTDAPCTPARRHVGYRVIEDADSVTVRFNGTLSSRCRPLILLRSVIPAERYARYVIPGLWRDVGGRLNGRVRNGELPDDASRIHAHVSRTAAEVVRATNKFSNNMMARQLLLTLGSRAKDSGIRVADGVAALHDWLRQNGIETPGLRIINGAGLSRDTRISARGLANVLRAGQRSRYAPEFLASLPLAGEDRALRKLRVDGEAGTVRVKTGLLDDVRAMAGYVTPAGGETYVVVLLVNHPGAQHGLGTRLQQALVDDLLDQ